MLNSCIHVATVGVIGLIDAFVRHRVQSCYEAACWLIVDYCSTLCTQWRVRCEEWACVMHRLQPPNKRLYSKPINWGLVVIMIIIFPAKASCENLFYWLYFSNFLIVCVCVCVCSALTVSSFSCLVYDCIVYCDYAARWGEIKLYKTSPPYLMLSYSCVAARREYYSLLITCMLFSEACWLYLRFIRGVDPAGVPGSGPHRSWTVVGSTYGRTPPLFQVSPC